tara:strand:- start:235 stop:816 length:582 start_codon:yes stop_codon:yes gene_type:complete
MIDIISQKKDLRKNLTLKRDIIKKRSTTEFNIDLFDNLKNYISFEKIKYVASFNSIRSEISTHELNNKIIDLNKILSFPVIQNNSEELIFKKFKSNETFHTGKFKIPEPGFENEEVIPQLFFVPCLGFDLNGYRIGYGGGFYDKTFAKLKKLKIDFYAVGYAFDEQKEDNIPKEEFDYKLDFVLTEKQLYKFL